MLAKEFGREVRARRKARGLTQAGLGEAAGLSEEWLRKIERGAGAPSFDAIEALANALDCSAADLFTPMNPKEVASTRIAGLLASASDADLAWLEDLVRVAIRRPTS